MELWPDGGWYTWRSGTTDGSCGLWAEGRRRAAGDTARVRVDNVRWERDGRLLVAGQGEPGGAVTRGSDDGAGNLSMSIVGRVDPKTMTYTTIVSQPANERLNAATVAIRIGERSGRGRSR